MPGFEWLLFQTNLQSGPSPTPLPSSGLITPLSPLANAFGVAYNAPVSFSLSPVTAITSSNVNVVLDGLFAVITGIFQPGYTGTVVQDTLGTVTVTILTHPAFSHTRVPVVAYAG
jgi:hypothetical protein